MAREGLDSLFPIEELSIVGFAAVVQQLPKILRLIRQTARCRDREPRPISSSSSTALISPTASRGACARAMPSIPIVDYVSPTVWAWRPGRARAMLSLCRPRAGAAAVRARGLSAPARAALQLCRPSPDRADRLAAARTPRSSARRDAEPPVLLVLPGSRRGEIRHHMAVFGETLARLQAEGVAFEPVLPTMPHLAGCRPRGREELAGRAAAS